MDRVRQSGRQADESGRPDTPAHAGRIDDLLCYGQLFGIADKLAEKWSKYLTEEKTTVVKLCREIAQSFFDGNNVATD